MSAATSASASPLMPKATAVWLIENTALSFDQIADFAQLHPLEIKALADGEVNIGMLGWNPILNGQLTKEEIERCEKDPAQRLKMKYTNLPQISIRSKGPRYTPVTKRGDKPDAIAWLIKNHSGLSDGAIVRLIGTTKNTIDKIRDRSHWNMQNIKPRDPVMLGLCKQVDLDAAVEKLHKHQPANEAVPTEAVKEMVISSTEEPSAPIIDLGPSSTEEQPSDEGFERLMGGGEG